MSAPRIKESPLGTIYIFPDNPITLARPRFANGVVYDSQKKLRKQWQQALMLLKSQSKDPFYQNQSLSLSLLLLFAIPRGYKKREQEAMEGQPCKNNKDADNCIKWIADISQDILFDNDKTIVEINALKLYSRYGATAFRITPFNSERISPHIAQFMKDYRP